MKQLNIYKKLKDNKSYNRAQIKEFSYNEIETEGSYWYYSCWDHDYALDWYDDTDAYDYYEEWSTRKSTEQQSKLYRATGFEIGWENYRKQYQAVV